MVKTSPSVDLEPIDRLEAKVKMLVAMLERMRAEQARVADENGRLARELDVARARLSEAEGANAEMTTLKAERDQIRTRVSDMLDQLEALSL